VRAALGAMASLLARFIGPRSYWAVEYYFKPLGGGATGTWVPAGLYPVKSDALNEIAMWEKVSPNRHRLLRLPAGSVGKQRQDWILSHADYLRSAVGPFYHQGPAIHGKAK
jgi:hypothetical protein